MKILLVLLIFISFTTFAAYDRNFGRNLKLPSQYMLERTTIAIPVVASTAYISSALSTALQGPTSAAAVTVSAGLTNPDVPRTVTIRILSEPADIEACNITVSGTNLRGESVTDVFVTTVNTANTITGNVAFKTVSSIAWAASCEASAYGSTYEIGVSDELGIGKCLAVAGDCAWATLDGAFETTDPTCVVDVDEVEKNTVDINGTLDGAKDVQIYFIQNFRDLP